MLIKLGMHDELELILCLPLIHSLMYISLQASGLNYGQKQPKCWGYGMHDP